VQVEYTGMRDSNSYKADRAMVGLSYAF